MELLRKIIIKIDKMDIGEAKKVRMRGYARAAIKKGKKINLNTLSKQSRKDISLLRLNL